ncbi:MAG: hypothetical protein V1835_02630 [Candidatus Micrarchaeota archaeon]
MAEPIREAGTLQTLEKQRRMVLRHLKMTKAYLQHAIAPSLKKSMKELKESSTPAISPNNVLLIGMRGKVAGIELPKRLTGRASAIIRKTSRIRDLSAKEAARLVLKERIVLKDAHNYVLRRMVELCGRDMQMSDKLLSGLNVQMSLRRREIITVLREQLAYENRIYTFLNEKIREKKGK